MIIQQKLKAAANGVYKPLLVAVCWMYYKYKVDYSNKAAFADQLQNPFKASAAKAQRLPDKSVQAIHADGGNNIGKICE